MENDIRHDKILKAVFKVSSMIQDFEELGLTMTECLFIMIVSTTSLVASNFKDMTEETLLGLIKKELKKSKDIESNMSGGENVEQSRDQGTPN